MKSMFRITGLAVLFAGLSFTSVFASSSTYNTSGWNYPNPTVTQTWAVTTAAATTINTTVSINVWYNASGGGSTNVTDSSNSTVLSVSAGGIGGGSGPRNYTNSGSTSGLPAGTYTLTHSFGGPTNYIQANLSTTFSW